MGRSSPIDLDRPAPPERHSIPHAPPLAGRQHSRPSARSTGSFLTGQRDRGTEGERQDERRSGGSRNGPDSRRSRLRSLQTARKETRWPLPSNDEFARTAIATGRSKRVAPPSSTAQPAAQTRSSSTRSSIAVGSSSGNASSAVTVGRESSDRQRCASRGRVASGSSRRRRRERRRRLNDAGGASVWAPGPP